MVRYRILLLALIAAAPALAGTRDEVYSASQRCAAITEDRSWLECYYGAAQPMRGQLQLPPAPASQTSLIPPATAVSAARPQAPRPAPPPKPGPVTRTLDYITGGAVIVSKMPLQSYDAGQGGFFVVLANGQMWRQSDDQPRFVRWRDKPAAHRVTIWQGALNTFNLGFDDENDRYKVRRVK
ncbi:MAG: hypothetical protein JO256_15540 [Alphaproteobacteria bacterium]|nr:hypothetical protein [Alphaproteobacteria bacterium]